MVGASSYKIFQTQKALQYNDIARNNDIVSHRYKLITPPDSGWGNKLPNGSWTGMLGQVIRQVRLEILSSHIMITRGRGSYESLKA